MRWSDARRDPLVDAVADRLEGAGRDPSRAPAIASGIRRVHQGHVGRRVQPGCPLCASTSSPPSGYRVSRPGPVDPLPDDEP